MKGELDDALQKKTRQKFLARFFNNYVGLFIHHFPQFLFSVECHEHHDGYDDEGDDGGKAKPKYHGP